MKILHVIASLDPKTGGPAKVVLDMCNGLADRGHDVTLLSISNEHFYEKTINPHGVRILCFPPSGLQRWEMSFDLGKFIKDELQNYQIVDIHSIYLYHTFITSYYCRKYKIPYIIRPHGSLDPFIRKKNKFLKELYYYFFEKHNMDNAAAIHYTALNEMELAHTILNIKAPGVVIPLGHDLSEFENLPAKGNFLNKYIELRNKKIILFLGRLHAKKGLDILIPAFSIVLKKIPDLHLVIVGPDEDNYLDKLKGWIKETRTNENITYLGMLAGEKKLEVYVDSELYVLPSHSENFGITLIEAMSCGTPVLTTRKVNIWKNIADGEAGYIVDDNVDDLASGLLDILTDKNLLNKFRTNGYSLVKTEYSAQIMAKRLEQLYIEIISGDTLQLIY